MIDLTIATNCINAMKKNGIYDNYKIGMVTKPIKDFVSYKQGEIVLFREELTHEERYGPKRQPTGTVTIESPLTQEEIDERIKENSLITTVRTIICVPKEYVEEVRA